MKIPVGYMDRRREGDTVLRQTQLVLLHLLHVIDRICSENGIRYWLAWGSCLGAMRHDGFIPWDDDLDIGLSVKDFKRLIKLLPRELPEDARLQVPADCPKVAIPFPKVRDCSSFLFESRPDISTADPSGIYIDIFPFVEIPKVPKAVSDLFYTVCGSSYHRYHFFLNKGARSVRSALWCVPLAAACRVVNLAAKGMLWLCGRFFPVRMSGMSSTMDATSAIGRNGFRLPRSTSSRTGRSRCRWARRTIFRSATATGTRFRRRMSARATHG